jgi:integrase
LSILVFPNGCKSFVCRYVSGNGVRRRLVLGDYPGLSLADARLKAQAVRIEVTAGADPAGERAAARAAARMGETLSDLAESYWKAAAIGLHGGRKRPLRPQTLERQKGLWKRHLAPALGSRRYREIRRADVRQFMHGQVLRGDLSAGSVAAIGDVLRALFTHALNQDLVESNPTVGLVRPIIPASRDRLFSEEGLSKLLASLNEASVIGEARHDPHARLGANVALALRFMLLTLTRRTEAVAARWDEIELSTRTWTIPGARTKNRQPHVVPLSAQAMKVLRLARALPGSRDDGYVFPSPAVANAHVDGHAATRAVSRLCARHGLPARSPHDFRRTGATMLTGERFRIRRFVVGKVLGHTTHEGAAVTAVYDRNEYLVEKREALEAWARYLEGLIETRDTPPGRAHLRLVSR